MKSIRTWLIQESEKVRPKYRDGSCMHDVWMTFADDEILDHYRYCYLRSDSLESGMFGLFFYGFSRGLFLVPQVFCVLK